MAEFHLRIGCVGKPESGKTTFIRRYRIGEFSRQYVATANIEENTIIINTTHGMIYCTVFDIPFPAGIPAGMHALFVFHVTGDEEDLNEYIRRGTEGSDASIDHRSNLLRVDIRSFADTDTAESSYLHVSAKNNKNISEPFARMVRELIESDATIIDNPAVEPLMITIPFWSIISGFFSRLFNWREPDDDGFDDLTHGDM